MTAAKYLTPEPEEARGSFVPVRDSQILVGHRIRIRDLVATGLREPAVVGGRRRQVASKKERIVIADVTRVAVGSDGSTYVSTQVVEGPTDLRTPRMRIKVGSAAMRARTKITKEISRDPGFEPALPLHPGETPVAHSTRTRTSQFRTLLDEAVAAGVSERTLWFALIEHAERYARQMHNQANRKRLISGKDEIPEPDDLGDREVASVRATRDRGVEPDWWLFPVVASARDDPAAFLAEYEG